MTITFSIYHKFLEHARGGLVLSQLSRAWAGENPNVNSLTYGFGDKGVFVYDITVQEMKLKEVVNTITNNRPKTDNVPKHSRKVI